MNLHCNEITCRCANVWAAPEPRSLVVEPNYIDTGIELAERYANGAAS